MKFEKVVSISTAGVFVLFTTTVWASSLPISPLIVKQGKESATSEGWAGQAGGTSGGSQAS